MKTKILIFLSQLIFIVGFAQNELKNYEIGCFFDYKGELINKYYDNDSYSLINPPKRHQSSFDKIERTHLQLTVDVEKEFVQGYYFDTTNKKTQGYINYSKKYRNFKFKSTKEAKAIRISPDESNGFVIGTDSFVVVNNFDYHTILSSSHSKKREFIEVIEVVDNLTFYKYNEPGKSSVSTYLFKKGESKNHITFLQENAVFRNGLGIEIFGYNEAVKDSFVNKEFDDRDIPMLVKALKYNSAYKNKEKIYFDLSWNEIRDKNNYAYYATVDNSTDSAFHISYFLKNDTKIYEGVFTSIFPHRKSGKSIYYYPNGSKRKEIIFTKNKPSEGKDFN